MNICNSRLIGQIHYGLYNKMIIQPCVLSHMLIILPPQNRNTIAMMKIPNCYHSLQIYLIR